MILFQLILIVQAPNERSCQSRFGYIPKFQNQKSCATKNYNVEVRKLLVGKPRLRDEGNSEISAYCES